MPLNREAMALVRKQVGKHPAYVFSYRGKPIRQVSTKARYQALERAVAVQNDGTNTAQT